MELKEKNPEISLKYRPTSREEALRAEVHVCDRNRNTHSYKSCTVGGPVWLSVPRRQDKEWLIVSRRAGRGMTSQVLSKLTAAFKVGKTSS